MKCKSAVILAGGKSTRMKFDKQELMVGGISLVGYTIQRLGEIFEQITVVTNRPELYKEYDVKTISDIYPGFGPISGIHTALYHSDYDLSYFLACDMPYINVEYIEHLDTIYDENHDGVMTLSGKHIEPMNAMYSRKLLNRIEDNIKKEKYRIYDLLDIANFNMVEEAVARQYDPEFNMFKNINTQEELRELEELGRF